MKGLPTLLLAHVESLLPLTDAAACISPRTSCSPKTVYRDGVPGKDHRICTFSCYGRTRTCGNWMSGNCSL